MNDQQQQPPLPDPEQLAAAIERAAAQVPADYQLPPGAVDTFLRAMRGGGEGDE